MTGLLNPELWLSLLTLTFLEIILGFDNLVFLSIVTNHLPVKKQSFARKLGLIVAVITRLILLYSIFWMTEFTDPLFTINNMPFSLANLIFIGGGLFLIVKATKEIHRGVLQSDEEEIAASRKQKKEKLWWVIIQIALLDIIFSLDSVITAVGMTRNYTVMAISIIIAVCAMLFVSDWLARMIAQYPSLKMLALSFLLLVGFVLIADGFGQHIPKPYIYFAMIFSLTVEVLSILAMKKKK